MAANYRRADNKSLAEAGMTPLLFLIDAADPAALDVEGAELKEMGIAELIAANTTATLKGKRLSAFLLAVELTERGIAPFFRRSDAAPVETVIFKTNDQEYDLFVFDLLWLAKHGAVDIAAPCDPDTRKRLFSFADSLFWLGNRPIWQIVKNLKLTDRYEWECRLLKSMPIKRKANGLAQSARHIYARMALDLSTIMRTGTDEATARLILQKRKRLWFCAEMCKWSQTETARLFKCMTGETLNKCQVDRQLTKIAKYKRRRKPRVDTDNDVDENSN